MVITGWGLVILLAVIGYCIIRRGWFITGLVFIALAGLCMLGTTQGPRIFSGVQTGVNGISTGIDQATSR
jgi:hypothetical protein